MRFGRTFYKLTGSGNDFVFVDAREGTTGLDRPERIREICARGTGVGADGIVLVEPSSSADFAIRYFNADGSLAELCGNASLCSVRLADELQMGGPGTFRFETGAGQLSGRIRGGLPEVDMPTVAGLQPDYDVPLAAGEERIGFATVGVPHLAVLVTGDREPDVSGRGRELRWHPSLAAGANVNFLRPGPDGWEIRTFERGVEGETLACGTGAVASAALLRAWGLEGGAPVRLRTRSGLPLEVRFEARDGAEVPALRGEGRVVYRGELADS